MVPLPVKLTSPVLLKLIFGLTIVSVEVVILLPAAKFIVPDPETLFEPGSKIRPPLPDLVIFWFMKICLSASKVKSLELPVIAALTVISPLWDPPPAVVTVTLLDESAVSRVPTFITASLSEAENDPEIFVSLPELIVMSYGSINHWPSTPSTDFVEIVISSISRARPEVSILPPFPLIYRLQLSDPFTVVFEFELWISDQTTISPPSPISKAEASSIVPSAIVVLLLGKHLHCCFASFHQSQLSPDFFPTVEIFEFSSMWIFSAVTLTEPPLFCWELAAITPEFNTFPLLADRYIFPLLVIPSALKDPEFL